MAQTYRIEVIDAEGQTLDEAEVVTADTSGTVASAFAGAVLADYRVRISAVEAGGLRTIAILQPSTMEEITDGDH